jgi:hypothetical protein
MTLPFLHRSASFWLQEKLGALAISSVAQSLELACSRSLEDQDVHRLFEQVRVQLQKLIGDLRASLS